MTNDEATKILFNAYHNEVQKGGRGCGKTDFRTALLMGANAILLSEQYEELREDFVDFVCSGTNNPAPYCKNRCDECVDGRGWCTYQRCRGFNPDGRQYN